MGRAKKLKVERLGSKLKQIRTNANLTQQELVKELGIEDLIYQGNISEYESGRREPPLPILLRYARLIGISLDVLVDDELDIS